MSYLSFMVQERKKNRRRKISSLHILQKKSYKNLPAKQGEKGEKNTFVEDMEGRPKI